MNDAPRLRPTFTIPLGVEREEAIERIREGLDAAVPANRWIGKGRWAELHVPGHERRIWSPHLSIRIDDFDAHHRSGGHPADTACVLFGRYAPRPEVWTGFVFFYAAVAFIVLLGAILGYVQWASNESTWGLWAVAVGAPVLLGLHLASWLGQRWSHDQMVELRDILGPVVEPLRIDVERTTDSEPV
ncbi:MAG TPA: hypothetical protein VJ925_06505 [Longimicrobiales bacterium]|nr:hypothetical protein [Longimicrobiales bacterium]